MRRNSIQRSRAVHSGRVASGGLGIGILSRARRVAAALIACCSVLVGLVEVVPVSAAPSEPVLLEDEWAGEIPIPSPVRLESTSSFVRGDLAPSLASPAPVRLSGGELTFDAGDALGRPIRLDGTPLSVQVLRPAEVTEVKPLSEGELTSAVVQPKPLSLPADDEAGVAPAGRLVVRVLSTEESMAAGFDGLAFAIDGSEELFASKEPVWLRLEIDWSELRANYGGEWESRLLLTATGGCRLERVVSEKCQAEIDSLPTVVNDFERQVLVVEVELSELARRFGESVVPRFGESVLRPMAAGDGGPGFGLSAGASSAYGNYASTSLAGSQRWSSGGNSGGFNWTYDITGPPTPGGSASTSLNYSSQAVDGMTADENTQGGLIGVGWSMPSSYVERRYKPCSRDSGLASNGTACWINDNAVLSLNGQSGELVKDANGKWFLENDPGWRVSRFESSTQLQGSIGVDGNKEYWVVTTQDGTQYWFGFGKEKGTGFDTPGAAGDPGTATNSVWTQPVVGNHATDPCYALSGQWCHQAYRWMLDRVVTPTGVTSTYFYETHVNTFGRSATANWATKYTSGGQLVRVEYGQLVQDADMANRHPAKIEFNYAWRCTAGDTTCTTQPTSSNGSSFPDIPADEICGEFATTCSKLAPTFFDWKMLTSVVTYRLVNTSSAADYHKVDEYVLDLDWVDNDDEDAYNKSKLWLRSIEHKGWQGYTSGVQTSMALPKVWFDSVNGTARLNNRSDHNLGSGVVKNKYYRINLITDELGGRTSITYSAEFNCSGASGWDTNTKRCYQRYYNPASGTPGFARWNKYVVTSITSEDLARSQPSVTTSYTYDDAGGMAWAHNDDPFAASGTTAWDEYRGYSWVEATTGTGSAASKTRSYFFRGMYGDKLSGGGSKTTTVTNSISETVNDVEWLAGNVYETHTKDGTTIKAKSFTRYLVTREISGSGNGRIGGVTKARRIGIDLERTNLTAAGKWTRTEHVYNATGRRTNTVDYGEVNSETVTAGPTGDDTCTVFSNNTVASTEAERFIEGLPRAVYSFAGTTCAGTAVISNVNYYYDGAPKTSGGLSQMSTVGLLTRTVTNYDYLAASNQIETSTTYENNGFHPTAPGYARPVTSTDARNKVSTASYTPKSAGSIVNRNDASVTSTAPIAGHTQTAWFDNFGRLWKTTDANNRSSHQCFDRLGRLTEVYLSDVTFTECGAGSPHLRYSYIAETLVAPSPRDSVAWSVQTLSLFATDTDEFNPEPFSYSDIYVESRAFVDGNGRSVQTQTLSPPPAVGRIVTRAMHDANGRVQQQSAPYPVAGWTFAYDTTVDTTLGLRNTHTSYDALGRSTTIEQRWGTGTTTQVAHQLTTVYDDTTLTSTTRVPNATNDIGATITTVDVHGRTIAITKNNNYYGNTTTTIAYANTTAGQVVTQTDAGSNTTITTTDFLGRTTSTDDPNGGYTAFTYYPTGQPRCVIDAKDQLRFFELDPVGRVTFERMSPGTTTCPTEETNSWAVLNAYTYDPAGGVGATASATSYDSAGNVLVTATVPTGAFDSRGRLTKTTVTVHAADSPSTLADNALDTPLTTEQHYTRDGQVWQTIYPALNFSGLTSNLASAETVTATFNYLGMPTRATSDFGTGVTYVDTTTYDPAGRITQRKLGGAGSAASLQRDYQYQDSDGRILTMQATYVGGDILQHDTYHYDSAGNTSKIVRNPTGSTNDETECFTYDNRQRLTRAFTHPSTTSDCSAHATGGPAPYDETYAVGNLERLLVMGDTGNTRTLDNTGSAAPVGACSAGTNTTKPHAVQWVTAAGNTSQTSGHTYTYDCNGSRLTDNDNTTTNTDYTHTWNPHNRLDTTTTTTNGNPAGNTKNIYDAGGKRALRIDTAANGDTTKTIYIGTIEYRWTSTNPSVVQGLRTYAGAQRGYDGSLTWTAGNTQGSLTVTLTSAGTTSRIYYRPYGAVRSGSRVNDRGFLNQVTDDTTALSYLTNRFHDPLLGHFLSVDPLVGKTGQPYLYANGTPITLSDPSGLDPGWAHDTNPCNDAGYYSCTVQKGGRSAGVQVKTGPRQLAERCAQSQYNSGCSVDEVFPVGTGPRTIRFLTDRINDVIDLDLTRGARKHNYPCFLCQKRDSTVWSADEAVFLALIYDYYQTDSTGDLKPGVRQIIGEGTDAVQIGDGKYVRMDVIGNVFFGFAMHQSGYNEQQALDFSHGMACSGGVCVQVVSGSVGATDASDDLAVSIGWDLCDCGRGDSSGGVTMAEAQQVLLDNFDVLLAAGGACTRPEDCAFSG